MSPPATPTSTPTPTATPAPTPMATPRGATTRRGRATTLEDVSRHVGVSIATVSRVLNDSPNVRRATRERIRRAMDELGYTVNSSARALVKQQTDTLGVLFPDIDNEFYREILSGINETARAAGLHLMVAFGLDVEHDSELFNDYLMGGRADAVILLNLGMPESSLRRATRSGTPVVLLDRPVPGASVATVRLDNVAGADAAMTHLLGHGYRRIAVLCGPEGTYDAEERWQGCTQALERAGVTLDDALIWPGDFDERCGHQTVCDWLDRHDPPEAIFGLNDPMAIGALHALREHGLSVPEDVAVVGFDDQNLAAHLGLTTVRCPMREMGQAATRSALNMLGTDDPAAYHAESVLATELVIRQSCGCPSPSPAPTPAPAGRRTVLKPSPRPESS